MEQNKTQILSGELIDEGIRFSFFELCQISHLSGTEISAMIQEGILEPSAGVSEQEWCFNHTALKRLHTAKRLQQDLHINLPGIALALDLLEELEQLRK